MVNDSNEFESYVARSPEEIRLARAALLLSRDEYSTLDIEAYLRRLDGMAERIGRSGAVTPEEQYDAIRRVLVEKDGFIGRGTLSADPGLSYLNRVMDQRFGLPLSLATIWLDVAASLDWPIRGIGLPGHFMLRHDGMGDNLFIDPFDRGRIRTLEECLGIAERHGTPADLAYQTLVSPVHSLQMLRRMLNNLASTYQALDDGSCLARVLRRMTQVAPEDPTAWLEWGRALLRNGAIGEAILAVERVDRMALEPELRVRLSAVREEIQARIAENN